MKPVSLFIVPEPEIHSGHSRLHLLVISIPAETGIPIATERPVRELIRYEYPVTMEFTIWLVFINIRIQNKEER